MIYIFRNNSPYASQPGSRELSPRAKSPMADGAFNFNSSLQSSTKTNRSSTEEPISLEDIEDCEEEEEVERFRICILGASGVGKTALVNQFLTSEYMNTYDASLGNILYIVQFPMSPTKRKSIPVTTYFITLLGRPHCNGHFC